MIRSNRSTLQAVALVVGRDRVPLAGGSQAPPFCGSRDVVDGVPAQAWPAAACAAPSWSIDVVQLAGLDQRGDGGPMFGAAIRAREQRVLPFILPMSGRSWKFIIGGTPISAARLLCVGWSSERRANSKGAGADRYRGIHGGLDARSRDLRRDDNRRAARRSGSTRRVGAAIDRCGEPRTLPERCRNRSGGRQ
jgi:hypothetical protein